MGANKIFLEQIVNSLDGLFVFKFLLQYDLLIYNIS